MWAVCRRISPEPEQAWQEVWERIFRALPDFDLEGAASFRTWSLTLAHRLLVDRWRRARLRAAEPLEEEPAAVLLPTLPFEAALAALPESHRRLLVLHHGEGLTLEEITRIEGVPLGTLTSRLHRARASLAAALGEPPWS